MMRFFLKILMVALCSSAQANSSSRLHLELKKLQQLSQNIDVRVPSRSPALPQDSLKNQELQRDEISLSQSAIQRSAPPKKRDKLQDNQLMQIDLDSFEKSRERQSQQRSNTPMYRGR